ncbi:sigma 54-interacting transcriptional regulator [Ectopseudomonas oleovorans]|jgi:PAS domain S-box-containing protein|uniref:Transcriptional regulator n=1 Tax=Ectopseudomonas oleovorans (strain CECT 5344) TaxID=1182590 RepID=H9N5E0_ECTO5|nr:MULTISPECIES: sigma 54-interacting transcriptional regulator [Pseudomonas]MAE22601.1 Fis family transcriptional regulator [Pseudomonas sp.]AFD54053.1 transcriptional regulator [Pseudomonas oleovorans CECT 5344]MDH1442240.1 sigma 54-interacting transcriptional regulator [Pseudomonas sp. GD03722]MDH2199305.1 sigma 54-interacting transcriptional regulator [Pseudomonas oleovorans]WGG00155.1 sigma 54-interacting transcriptional regulator [Pseudomonas sp. GD03721]
MSTSEPDYLAGWADMTYASRHMVFEHCSEAIVQFDPVANRFVDMNIAASKLFGYARHELLNMTVTRLLGHQLPELIVFTQAVLEAGKGWSDELSCTRKDGERVMLEISATTLRLKGVLYLILVLRERSEQRYLLDQAQTERTMRGGLLEWRNILNLFQETERDNHLLLSAVGDGIYSIDSEGLATYVNPAAARMLGWETDEMIGKNIHRIHHHSHADGSHYPVEDCPIYKAVHDGLVHEGRQEVFWRRDGSMFPVEFTSTPVISDGRIVGSVVVFRDITERMSTQQRLHDALEELRELKQRLEQQNEYLQEEIRIEHSYREIVGQSDSILKIVRQIDVVGPTDASVLIHGESGTGKELIARAIHQSSRRAAHPLIRVNCAAIPADLFESEFFGHVRGAFTGALRDRIGRFELADGGTLFLDEVGEIPLELQSKLLRVLQEGQFERVGEERTRRVDVRIIAATNRDLRSEVESKRFREDLYFRLNVFPLQSPALRARREDIPMLASHFIKQIGKRLNLPDRRLSNGDIARLQSYNWPGNIRELQNVIERALITSNGPLLRIDLPSPDSMTEDEPHQESRPHDTKGVMTEQQIRQLEIDNLHAALATANGRLFGPGGAAELLGIKPTTLASRLKKLGITQGK